MTVVRIRDMVNGLAVEIKDSLTPWRRFKRRWRGHVGYAFTGFTYGLPRITLVAWILQESEAWTYAVLPLSMVWGATSIFAMVAFSMIMLMSKTEAFRTGEVKMRRVSVGFFAVSGIPLMFGWVPYAFALIMIAECTTMLLLKWEKKRFKSLVWTFGHVFGAVSGFVVSIPLLALGSAIDALSLFIRPWRLESTVRSKPTKEEFLQERAKCSSGGG